jgi:hypothetical protein
VTTFASVVLDKPEDWVMENLDIAEIIGLIVPLLRNRTRMIQEKVQPYLVKAQEKVEKAPKGVASFSKTIQ